jgi:hypothetical protein
LTSGQYCPKKKRRNKNFAPHFFYCGPLETDARKSGFRTVTGGAVQLKKKSSTDRVKNNCIGPGRFPVPGTSFSMYIFYQPGGFGTVMANISPQV